ncbi:MAG: potassium transporter TrkG [Bacteroidales bacterium]
MQITDKFYFVFLLGIIISIPLKYFIDIRNHLKLRIWIIDLILWLFYNFLLVNTHFNELVIHSNGFHVHPKIWLFIAFSVSCLRELSALKFNWRYKYTNPAVLFVSSFLLIILVGSFLLMLPRATYSGIGFSDALFTSTSAVCVTGLVVVDTGTYFTMFGQLIILILIQLGGIGIMTFTSFFSYFFMGGSSFQTLIMLGNLTNENKITQVVGSLKKIIFFTFLVETVAFLLIYLNIRTGTEMNQQNQVFFSIFHAVSAFCNAGFSTISDSFYNIQFRYNYYLHIIVALSFIVGGLGFPVIINLYTTLKNRILNIFYRIIRMKGNKYQLTVLSLNTKLVLYSTLILLIIGTLAFYFSEFNNTLMEHRGFGKMITAFFGAATPRTAGFNTVDTSAIGIPTMMFIIFLMWVGASPGSTGGGIKTSTMALGLLNVVSLARGKDRIELGHRQINELSIRRAFSFMFLSILVIGIVVSLLFITESEKSATDLIFEVFSAFSTVGLSRGITGDLSQAGKVIIVFTMFIGRVGTMTLLVSLMRKSSRKFIQYPTEGILIN